MMSCFVHMKVIGYYFYCLICLMKCLLIPPKYRSPVLTLAIMIFHTAHKTNMQMVHYIHLLLFVFLCNFQCISNLICSCQFKGKINKILLTVANELWKICSFTDVLMLDIKKWNKIKAHFRINNLNWNKK